MPTSRATWSCNMEAPKPKKTITFTDDESDSDFINNAPYIEPKKARVSSAIKFKKLKVGNSIFRCAQNPLKQWLGSDLDIGSVSESEDVPGNEEELTSMSEEENESFQHKPGRIKARFIPTSQRLPLRQPTPVESVTITSKVEEESVTEPDTDEDAPASGPSPAVKPHSPTIPLAEESVTEPDSDEDVSIFESKRKAISISYTRPAKRIKIETHDDSVTEPDTEDEEYHTSSQSGRLNANAPPPAVEKSRNPRPQLSSISPPSDNEPFVLDTERGIQVPSSINCYLRDYQREGVQFFYDRYKEGRGGILGDDMGLGKTIQVIAFLSAIMKKTGDDRDLNRRQRHVEQLQDSTEWKRHRKLPAANSTWPTALIIVPSSVVHNWERELHIWGYFEVGIYAGSSKERQPILRDFQLGRLDVLITSFTMALKEIDKFESMAWSCIFVDEAHRLKNSNSQTTIAFNRFNCLLRFGLTGTAIQNNYAEFWNILDWSSPGRLGTLAQWNEWVTKPLIQGQDSKATPEQIATSRIIAQRLVERLLPQFFKRRTKDIISHQLPKKIDQVVFCPLTDMQRRVYKNFLNTSEVKTMLKKEEPCDQCKSGKLGKDCHYSDWDKAWVFYFMSILLKISNHLALILPAPNDTPEQTQRHREQANIGWPVLNGIPQAPTYGEAVFDPRLCGKWKVLKDLLEVWHKERDNKVLIFTKSVKLLEMLEHRLNESFMNFRKLDGSVKQSERMSIVDEFNEDPEVFVFLISIMAGGVGLNLVAANKVVIFDPNWNPAHDLQAQDRAFRFGQRRDVSVYRLLGAGSLEELIYKRQIYKQQQMKIGYEASHQTRYFEGVQGDKTKQGELWGIKNIFKLDETGTATKATIEKSHVAQLDWALSNLEGSSGGAKKGDQDGDMKGLASLLLGIGDDAPPKNNGEENEILKILNSNGVSYTHHNDDLLKVSAIETRLAKKAIETKRRREEEVRRSHKRKDSKKNAPDPNWPPKRRHHKSHMAKITDRADTLRVLGYIQKNEDAAKFAERFIKQINTEEDLNAFFIELDKKIATLKAAEQSSPHSDMY